LPAILPAITDDVNDFPELLALVRKNNAQARKLDPLDCGFEEPAFEISTQAEVWIVRLFVPVALGAIVTLIFTRGIPFFAIASVAMVWLFWLFVIFGKNKKRLRKVRGEGTVVASALIMANDLLFDEESDAEAPGCLLFSFDETLGADRARLIELADRIFRFRSTPAGDIPADCGEIAHVVIDETFHDTRWKVPRSFCGNDRTWIADCIMPRADLPKGYVDRRIWFGLAHPAERQSAFELLPLAMWWREDFDRLMSSFDEDEGEAAA